MLNPRQVFGSRERLDVGQPVLKYVIIMALWWGLSGWAYIRPNVRNGAPAFRVIEDVFSLRAWGWIMVVMAALAVVALIRPSAMKIRMFLTMSIGVKLAFAVGILVSWTWSPGFVSYLMLAAVDALVVSLVYQADDRVR